MRKEVAERILAKVKTDYGTIAREFSDTRAFIWPEMELLAERIKSGDRVLDAGCGNGRFLDVLAEKDIDYTGVDNQEAFLEVAKKKHPMYKFEKADLLNLPFHDGEFDVVVLIAVLQHIPSKEYRAQAIENVLRVLKKGGLLLMTNWNFWQEKYILKYPIKYSIKKIFGRTKLDFKDLYFKPWNKGEVDRYYHAFTRGEIRDLLESLGLSIIKNGYYLKEKQVSFRKARNIMTVAKKR